MMFPQHSAGPRSSVVWRAALLLAIMGSLLVGSLPPRGATRAQTLPYKDPANPVSVRVDDLLARMTLDEKIGQMTQADLKFVSAGDISSSLLGSVLSGGGSVPGNNTPTGWADMYDSLQRAAMSTRLGIPIIYGIDAVHGHNNVPGATIFPHNIGLGATRNPTLVQAVGRATAEEVAATGIDWTFSPCLCVARDERWGRTYESFGEDPEIASAMTTIVDGYQGASLNGATSILATAKHYVGDGGTTFGSGDSGYLIDQGNTQLSEAELRRLHIEPFRHAIQRNVGSIMPSYSSWNGQKLHSQKYLLTDVLKTELGFKGFIISDWAAIDQIPGDYASDVRTSINAGLDMIMVPEFWRNFISTLRSEVQAGRITQSRIDDAVRRILTKKFELGLFERPYTDRSLMSHVGSAAHRSLARDAVRQSLVLLKNSNNILPLAKTGRRIFVAGKNADNLGNQSGGWTLSWQGQGGNVPGGTSILQGIRSAAAGSTVTYSSSGSGIDSSYNVAIVVIGETPYAEGKGDRGDSMGLDATDINTLNTVRASGVPMVVVMVSGRPLVVTNELPNWAAFVAAWLPGTEGQGVADMLFGDYNPTGKLPITWPRSAAQIPINVGDSTYDPLFAYGFGLSYGTTPTPTHTSTPSPTRTMTASPTRTNTSGVPTNTSTTGPSVTRTSTVPAVQNLLLNAGFETDGNGDGDPDSWTSHANVARSTAARRSGTYSIRHQSTANNGYVISQVVGGITPGASYSFSGYTNIPATSDTFTYRIELVWRNSGNGTISTSAVRSFTGTTNGAWIQASGTYTAPANTTNVVVRMNVSSLNATIYSDDFSLTRGTPPPPSATRSSTTGGASHTATSTSPAATTAVPPATETRTSVPPATPTSGPATGLKVQYRAADAAASSNQIKPHLNIVNGGSSGVALSELKARYYYSKEGTANEQYFCDYAVVGCGNVTGSFVNGYLEVGFGSGAGTLAAGGQTGEIQSRFAKTDWSNYTQTGDYSFDPTKTAFADWSRVTLYRSGTLVWGTPAQ